MALLPAAMLVATTTHITESIAPMPFLWVIPLLLYLASLVLAFRGWGGSNAIALITVILAGVSYSLIHYSYEEATTELTANILLLFFGSLYCHAMLYRLRPEVGKLSYYYVVIALGGLIGTVLMSIVAPVVVKDFFEFTIGIGFFAATAIIFFPAQKYVRDEYATGTLVIKACLLLGIVFALYADPYDSSAIYTSRNFYGQVRIREYNDTRWFSHGTTVHGSQFLGEDQAHVPTTYYAPASGIGHAIAYEQKLRGKDGINVGVLGLGAGSIAAHCRPNDRYTFYEIDPRVADVAREYFTYLKNCEHSDVRFGDGRLLLERELKAGTKGAYDVLVIAAYSDDVLPTHLLTKEAVALYLEHLRSPQSILAIITSTRYLNSTDVALRIAEELNVPAKYFYTETGSSPGAYRSDWVLLSTDPKTLEAPQFDEGVAYAHINVPLWTDDYVNLFGVLDLPKWYWWGGDEE